MPQIIVTADREGDLGNALVMFRERVTIEDLGSEHFAQQLLERLAWGVGDAHEAERGVERTGIEHDASRDARHVELEPALA